MFVTGRHMTQQNKTLFAALAAVLLMLICGFFATASGPSQACASLRLGSVPLPGNGVWGLSASAPDGTWIIGIVSDLDKRSKVDGAKKPRWKAIFKKGRLTRDNGSYSISWLEEKVIIGEIGEAGRGMELSELTSFQGKLLGFDDRTGLAYEITESGKAIPKHVLTEGDGNVAKGQKTEWATVKDGLLFVGSFGKEYTSADGKQVTSTNNLWIKRIDAMGTIEHLDWSDNYSQLRNSVGCAFPGYLIIEAMEWDPINKSWVCLPRRVSQEPYDENLDEKRGSNKALIASPDFRKIEVREIGTLTPVRGFSSFKFVPGTKNNVVVALKSEENEEAGATQTAYICVIDLTTGEYLMPETEIAGGMKFEGLEFL